MVKLNSRLQGAATVGLIAIFAMLAGCGSDQTTDVHVRGQLTLAGQGQLPKDATARISLIEHAADSSDNRIVAERTLHDLGKLPVHFNLAIGRELLGSNGRYGLNAQVLNKGGNVAWETPVPQSIEPTDQAQPAMLVLQASDFHAVGDFQQFQCADEFQFDMTRSDGQAILRMGKRQISLTAQPTGDASRSIYTDDHGDELAFGHDKITLTMDDTTHMDCHWLADGDADESVDTAAADTEGAGDTIGSKDESASKANTSHDAGQSMSQTVESD
ncbi:YbaY family lipoprotein [Salinisphaera sp. SPP-AMP-43]|uniref:YbaY family lipoprotein n=1 Tax=Salinisphaera sp. SPP-AMP-43 TaxID=3121288 RepID=UPI003C6E88D3